MFLIICVSGIRNLRLKLFFSNITHNYCLKFIFLNIPNYKIPKLKRRFEYALTEKFQMLQNFLQLFGYAELRISRQNTYFQLLHITIVRNLREFSNIRKVLNVVDCVFCNYFIFSIKIVVIVYNT